MVGARILGGTEAQETGVSPNPLRIRAVRNSSPHPVSSHCFRSPPLPPQHVQSISLTPQNIQPLSTSSPATMRVQAPTSSSLGPRLASHHMPLMCAKHSGGCWPSPYVLECDTGHAGKQAMVSGPHVSQPGSETGSPVKMSHFIPIDSLCDHRGRVQSKSF